MKKFRLALIAIFIMVALLTLSACGNSNIVSYAKTPMDTTGLKSSLQNEDNVKAYANFSANLFRNSYNNDNSLVSPLSAYIAFSMLNTGAEGNTRKELENALGLDTESLNAYCGYLYARYAENEETAGVTKTANGIWVKDDFDVKDSFLTINSQYYGATVYKSDFGTKTVKEINSFVNKKTDGMIKKAVNNLNPDDVMVLVNTLFFENKWQNKNYRYQDMEFTLGNGTKVTVDAFQGCSNKYFYSERACAFRVPFDNNRFAFMGILPDEDVDFESYVNSFTGEELLSLMTEIETECDVYWKIPKFSFKDETDLSIVMKKMGVNSAFLSDVADFSNLSDAEMVYVSKAVQQTAIELDKNGVKAAAATVLVNGVTSAGRNDKEIYLYLDRPFMFAIIDAQYNVPLFVGAVTNPK